MDSQSQRNEEEINYNDLGYEEVTMKIAIGCLVGMTLGLVAALTFRWLVALVIG